MPTVRHGRPAWAEKLGGHPKNIILLTCDASGVMPPIAKLTPEQALYHFISGYTSKIAGTEIGLGEEPEITFSTCFGGPFMVHRPSFYAEVLRRKIERHGVGVAKGTVLNNPMVTARSRNEASLGERENHWRHARK